MQNPENPTMLKVRDKELEGWAGGSNFAWLACPVKEDLEQN